MKKMFIAAVLFFSCFSQADIRPGNPNNGGGYGSADIYQRVSDLERTVYDLNRRLNQLESAGRPEPFKEVSCMLTSDTYYTVFLGKGRTPLEAEANVMQSCQKALNGLFCKKVSCDDPQQSRSIRGAVCVLTANTYNTTFKGEGSTLMEAEFNARKACQDKVAGMFCNNNVPVRCETY